VTDLATVLPRAEALVRTLCGQPYVEAPVAYTGAGPSLFLAGGITDCSDWQAEARKRLAGSGFDLLNPRRANFPMDDPGAAEEQITWEHDHLRKADAILFWFPAGAVQPIALYELGAWSMTGKPLFVGADPGYARRPDVEIQTKLARPGLPVVSDLGALVQQVKASPVAAWARAVRRSVF